MTNEKDDGMKGEIWKYVVVPNKLNIVTMPEHAKILAAHEQNNRPTIWAHVDPDAADTERRIYVAETGTSLPRDLKEVAYIGTCLCDQGGYVVHVFEVR